VKDRRDAFVIFIFYGNTSKMAPDSFFAAHCLQGRVALVTGGGSGICFEIARQFARFGARVVICGRRAAFLQQAANILNQESTIDAVEYQVCDVRNPEICQSVVDYVRRRFGRLDILVNGAAGNFLAAASDLSSKGFETVMAIDALGTFNMSRAAYNLLAETAAAERSPSVRPDTTSSASRQSYVCVINISATLHYGATWWQAHASAAKAAVDSLTRSLALEWGQQDKIRVNGIAPGPIADTPGMAKLAPGLSADEMSSMIASGIPLGRLGTCHEIAEAAVYLCLAQYVTGHVLVVDGGEWLYKEPRIPHEMVAELSRKVEAPSRAQGPRSKL
jgi:2,4-dienoyl-CoA reductase [(3E)-enoyl-CoA-producing], peroxisomal